MNSATVPSYELCSYCGLPVGGASRSRLPADEQRPLYCCLGCRVAAGITSESGESGEARWTLTRLGLAIFFSMNVMVFTMALWSWDVYEIEQRPVIEVLRGVLRYACLLFSAPVLILLGGPILESVLAAFAARRVTSDLLLLIGAAAAFVYSAVALLTDQPHVYFEVGCMILVAATLGRWLEATGKLRASKALRSLRNLLPETATRIVATTAEQVPLEEVQAGDLVKVLPGDRIPLDGRIESRAPNVAESQDLAGGSRVDEQIVTGESRPRRKVAGDPVYGGSLNLDAELLVRVTATSAAGSIARLVNAVEQAALTKSVEIRLADRLAAWFVPATALIAAATFAAHYQQGGFQPALMSSLAVILIACPCALGIATPLALWAAIGAAASQGVLVRRGDALSRLARLGGVCFDKTGTITSGDLEVVDVGCVVDRDRFERVAVTLAKCSTHPLSKAIANSLTAEPLPIADQPREERGRGVVAGIRDCDDRPMRAVLGNPAFVSEQVATHATISEPCHVAAEGTGDWSHTGPVADDSEASDRLQGIHSRQAHRVPSSYDAAVFVAAHPHDTVVGIGWDGALRGAIAIREAVRPEVATVIGKLREQRLAVRILTGDRSDRARSIEAETGIETLGELLPEDKLAAVQAMQLEVGCVAMVGDGINDAPALATADIGIALESGADVSRDAADICLLGGTLTQLPYAIVLARDTAKSIKFNLAWATAYNVIGVGLAAAGYLNPVVAAAAMVGSSFCVITNSLNLASRHTGTPRSLPVTARPPAVAVPTRDLAAETAP